MIRKTLFNISLAEMVAIGTLLATAILRMNYTVYVVPLLETTLNEKTVAGPPWLMNALVAKDLVLEDFPDFTDSEEIVLSKANATSSSEEDYDSGEDNEEKSDDDYDKIIEKEITIFWITLVEISFLFLANFCLAFATKDVNETPKRKKLACLNCSYFIIFVFILFQLYKWVVNVYSDTLKFEEFFLVNVSMLDLLFLGFTNMLNRWYAKTLRNELNKKDSFVTVRVLACDMEKL